MSYLPYNTARYILENFEKMYLSKYAFHKYSKHIKGEIPESIVVYLVEDSLVLLIDIIGNSASVCSNAEEMYGYYRNNDFLEFPITGETYYKIRIEELTPNEIGLKYVHSKFVKRMEEITKIDFLPGVMSYNKFESDRTSPPQYERRKAPATQVGYKQKNINEKEKIMFRYWEAIRSAQTIHWRCSKCGRTADSSVKPVATYGGGCPRSTNRMHSWTKSHF